MSKFSSLTFINALALLACMNVMAAGDIEVSVTDAKGRPLADAVVFAEGGKGNTASTPPQITIAQNKQKFHPAVSVIPVGTSVLFPNKDRIQHHVYSFSKAKRFEIPLYKGTPPEPITFDKEGAVVIGCNIHDWMKAYIYVVDTDFYAKTDAAGKAVLKGIPDGTYKLKVWHARQKSRRTLSEKLTVDGSPGAVKLVVETKPAWGPGRAPISGGGRY